MASTYQEQQNHGASNQVESADELEFYASCPEGFEVALADELRSLGLRRVRRLKGRVSFGGQARDAYRACLWSRLASRVFLVIGRIDASNADALYANAKALPWEDILRAGASIAVSARGTNGELRNSHFAALRVKDALCDHLLETTGVRPSVDAEYPDAHLTLAIRGERASLHLDLSGDPLFKRLPREAARLRGAHVLRPDYAALMLAQAQWQAVCAAPADADAPASLPALIDCSCAGGGIELEAVSCLLDRAPGFDRERWGFEGWAQHDADAWNELVAEARTRAEQAKGRTALIVATDASAGAVEFARRIMRKAGFARHVRFVEPAADAIARELSETIDSLAEGAPPMKGALTADASARDGSVTGAPTLAGALIADTTEVALNQTPTATALVFQLRQNPALRDLPLVTLTRDDPIRLIIGPAFIDNDLLVKPGNEDARIRRFASPARAEAIAPTLGPTALFITPDVDGAEPTQANTADATTLPPAGAPGHVPTFPTGHVLADLGDGKPLPVLVPESEQFARRLKKVARLRRKWAAREGVTCYRVYDADLPDYAAAIDLYEGSPATPGRWLVVAEYAAPKSVDPALAQARLLDILAIAPRVLDVDPEHVYAKSRMRSRGGSQYGKRPHATGNGTGGERAEIARRHLPLIEEGGLTFAVNFDDYLDTGIFLDHRVTRGLVREYAKDARWFLNLFAYTGTATCYAADAGVEETVTVDLSNTYLDWAERNMRQNGFTGREHHYVRADVLRWISEQRRTQNRWDLIFCDPPTFSNSSKMGRRSFDVQRDHVDLIIGISRLLTREGKAIFSCNLRTFRPDIEALARGGVVLTDISAQTIPEDFARNPRIHRCYIVERTSIEEAMRRAGLDAEAIARRQSELKRPRSNNGEGRGRAGRGTAGHRASDRPRRQRRDR